MKYHQVVVIGCGPAGLAAAHAASGLGYPVKVIAPLKKTPQRGPLLLQRAIPGITNDHPDGYIRQITIHGGILDYRKFLYRDVNVGINGDILKQGYHAWRFPAVYDALWDMYHDHIEDRKVTGAELTDVSAQFPGVLFVNTAPLNLLCEHRSKHEFRYFPVYVTPESSFPGQPEDTIIFNGGTGIGASLGWSRSSRIFGNECTEWPLGHIPAESLGNGLQIVNKPLSTTCDCFPDVLKTGRFGSWHNETWVDSAYFDTRTALISRDRSDVWTSVFMGKQKSGE